MKLMGSSKKLHRILASLIIFIFIIPAVCFTSQFKVIRVTDGDTIKVTGNGSNIIVRLVGIDAPETSKKKHEPGQPFSRKSTKHLASLVLNKSVDVRSYGNDRYGRTLGVIFVKEMNVNLEMVKAGLAEVYRGRPAKGLDLVPYWDAEAGAKKAGRGMWSLGDKSS
jgi:endonuclease YncB( thermonuclease family)